MKFMTCFSTAAFLLCLAAGSTRLVEEPAAISHQSICSVDVSESPQLAEFARQLPALCDDNYPAIKRKLISDSFQPPSRIQLVFKETLSNPAEALGDRISLSSKWFTEHPDDLGAIVHEMAHVAQAYPPGRPFWLTEGIADYIRYWRGYGNSWSYAHCGPGSEHYTSGYWCSAAFLKFIEANYDEQIVANLNKALRENGYDEKLFSKLTGKNLGTLWQECLEKDCKGGKP